MNKFRRNEQGIYVVLAILLARLGKNYAVAEDSRLIGTQIMKLVNDTVKDTKAKLRRSFIP